MIRSINIFFILYKTNIVNESLFVKILLVYFIVRTNLPKEVMGYPDFPIPEQFESYLSRAEILDFLNAYCDHFELRPHIRVSEKKTNKICNNVKVKSCL